MERAKTSGKTPTQKGSSPKYGMDPVFIWSGGRADDNEVTIKKRIQNYFDESLPVIDYYKEKAMVNKIDATGTIE